MDEYILWYCFTETETEKVNFSGIFFLQVSLGHRPSSEMVNFTLSNDGQNSTTGSWYSQFSLTAPSWVPEE